MEQHIGELDLAQTKLNKEIKEGEQNLRQRENLKSISTEEVEKFCREILRNTFHKYHKEETLEENQHNQHSKPTIQDEKDKFWKDIWSPGIHESGPDVKQKAEFQNIITESYEKYTDPRDMKNTSRTKEPYFQTQLKYFIQTGNSNKGFITIQMANYAIEETPMS